MRKQAWGYSRCEFQPNKDLLFIPHVFKVILRQRWIWASYALCSFLLHHPHFYVWEIIWTWISGKHWRWKCCKGREKCRWLDREEKREDGQWLFRASDFAPESFSKSTGGPETWGQSSFQSLVFLGMKRSFINISHHLVIIWCSSPHFVD